MNVGTRMTAAGHFSYITTLEEVVAAYRRVFPHLVDGKGHNDPIVAYCRAAKNLPDAIRKACAGIKPDGKMFHKGSYVRAVSRAEKRDRLLESLTNLRRSKSFEELHDLVEAEEVFGIAGVLNYNIAERIGAYLGIVPTDYVYLHAGPLEGWKRLTGRRKVPHRVAKKDLPKALQKLSVVEIEDMFCEFRLVLSPRMWS